MTTPTDHDQVLDRLQTIVTTIASPHRTPADVGPGTALGHGGFWLDSIALLEVIIACEAEFGITFDSDADLTARSLNNVGSLAELIVTRMILTKGR